MLGNNGSCFLVAKSRYSSTYGYLHITWGILGGIDLGKYTSSIECFGSQMILLHKCSHNSNVCCLNRQVPYPIASMYGIFTARR